MLDTELDTFARLDLVVFLEGYGWRATDKDSRYTKMERDGANRALWVSQMPSGVWVWNDRYGSTGKMAWDYLQVWERIGTIGHARAALRAYAGTARPERPAAEVPTRRAATAAANSNAPKPKDHDAVRRRWVSFAEGAPYLITRGIGADLITLCASEIRTDSSGNACCAHRLIDGTLVGYEIKGPRKAGDELARRTFTSFSSGGSKSIFKVGRGPVERLVVTEAAIDALSLAQHEGMALGTRYVSLYGEPGPTNVETLRAIARRFPGRSWATAFDGDAKGLGFAEQVRAIVGGVDATAVVDAATLPAAPNADRPFKDWNEVVCRAEYLARLEREAARARALVA